LIWLHQYLYLYVIYHFYVVVSDDHFATAKDLVNNTFGTPLE
jgi:hypothetical protein